MSDNYPPTDMIGRQYMRPFSWVSFVRAMPWLATEVFDTKVPGDFWAQDTDEEGEPIAIIACPCGEEPTLHPGEAVECSCERFYLAAVDQVRVFRPEHVEAAVPRTDTPTEVVD